MGGRIRVGVGGWRYEPWRGPFYPDTVRRDDELAHLARRLASTEINVTFHRTQTEATFRRWRAAVPPGFVFAVKAPRAATHAADPTRAAEAVERFLGSGLLALGPTLGPILWQFAPGRRFDPDGLDRFLRLLPAARDGVPLRHAVELRRPRELDAALAWRLASREVALALVARGDAPPVAALTAPFVYARLEDTRDEETHGYDSDTLRRWTGRLRALADGTIPDDLRDAAIGADGPRHARDVFAFVIAGAKARNPLAAEALAASLR